jgi:hypothetical protein
MIRLAICKPLHKSIAPLLSAIFLFGLAILPARAQEQEDRNKTHAGFDVAQKDAGDNTVDDGNPGVTASDFYKLLDNSIGDNFSGLVLVFGGCYTHDFSTQASGSKIAKKPVAILAATSAEDKDRHQCTPSLDGDNPFLTGLIGTWTTEDNDGKPISGTATQAFNAGKDKMTASVADYNGNNPNVRDKKVKPADASNPTLTTFPDPKDPNSPGGKLTLSGPEGEKKGEKYAILFIGSPQTYYDWNQVQAQYQSLINSGYPQDHIDVLFGTGGTAQGDDRGSPLLSTPTVISVNAEARERGKARNGVEPSVNFNFVDGNGQTKPVPFKAATFNHLKGAFARWKVYAGDDKASANQYFILIGDHSTPFAHPRDPKDLTLSQLSVPNSGGGPYYAGGPLQAPTPGEASMTPTSTPGPSSTTSGFTTSVAFAPPGLPVYEQPRCPSEGHIWTPGYWAWGDNDYYWVPGTWVEAPEVGFLWTPAYWGLGGGSFIFYQGYWGPRVGFYGGINYGYGYFGHGYEGGHWDHDRFYYNRAVNNLDVTEVHNVYEARIENNHNTTTRVSYNGGNGGINERPRPEEEAAALERHIPPVPAQVQHVQAARTNPQLRASTNQGKPPIAATPTPGAFKESGVVPAKAGGRYNPPAPTENNAAARTGTGDAARTTAIHPKDIPPAERPAPANTGNPEVDMKYQQQQDKLITKQEQDRQILQQKQDQDHQRLAQKNAGDARKQQVEQQHQQQTQQLTQKHDQQQQKLQQKQQQPPRQNEAKPSNRKP